jgi:hypothetical protein
MLVLIFALPILFIASYRKKLSQVEAKNPKALASRLGKRLLEQNLAPKLGNRLIFKKQELITALKKILRVYINDVQ